MPKRSPKEETRDELKAFLTKEALITQLNEQIFRVLDIDKTKSFTKDDLQMFLGFFQEECGLKLPEGAALESLLIKKVGVKELHKINEGQLRAVMMILMED